MWSLRLIKLQTFRAIARLTGTPKILFSFIFLNKFHQLSLKYVLLKIFKCIFMFTEAYLETIQTSMMACFCENS